MGPDKKKFKTSCHLTFLEKKSLDLLPIKVKTKNQDQSPPSKKKLNPKKKIDPPINKNQNQKRISIPP